MGNPPPGPSWWQRLRHPWVIIPAVLVLATGIWWFGFRSSGTSASAASPTQQLVAVTKGPIGSTVSAEGTVAAAQTDDLSFSSVGHRHRGEREGGRHGDRRPGAGDHRLGPARSPPQASARVDRRHARRRSSPTTRRPARRPTRSRPTRPAVDSAERLPHERAAGARRRVARRDLRRHGGAGERHRRRAAVERRHRRHVDDRFRHRLRPVVVDPRLRHRHRCGRRVR